MIVRRSRQLTPQINPYAEFCMFKKRAVSYNIQCNTVSGWPKNADNISSTMFLITNFNAQFVFFWTTIQCRIKHSIRNCRILALSNFVLFKQREISTKESPYSDLHIEQLFPCRSRLMKIHIAMEGIAVVQPIYSRYDYSLR